MLHESPTDGPGTPFPHRGAILARTAGRLGSIVSFAVGDASLSMICRKCLVGGRVQGVFYRATAARRAQELGIRGYARNLADGRVEVLACGETAAVEAFVKWLWIGSSACKVTSVDSSDVPVDPQLPAGFHSA
jgi:acylphosphatase